MSDSPNIFISYNSGSEFEQTLAIRLQTIGAVHGFNIYLPDRYLNSKSISIETQSRINLSSYYILFSTKSPLSKIAEQEVQYAYQKFQKKSNIIIIYDAAKGKNIIGAKDCTELFYDHKHESIDIFISRVINTIKSKKSATQNEEALSGLLIAGVALLVLGLAMQEK